MRVHDHDILYKRNSRFYQFGELCGGSVSAEHKNSAITSRAFDAARWSTSYNASGEYQEGLIVVPKDWDPNWPLGFRIHWTGSSAGNLTWRVGLDFVALDGAIPTTGAGTDLDTLIALDTLATAYDFTMTSRGIKNANWANNTQVTNGHYAAIKLECTAGTIDLTSEIAWGMWLEVDYVPMLTRFPHSEHDAPLDNALS